MQMILKIISLALAMIAFNLYFPWWIFTLLAFIAAWFCNSLNKTIKVSGSASMLSWLPLLLYSYLNDGDILFTRVSHMMGLSYPFILILSSGIVSVLLGGLAGLAGYYVKELFNDN